MEYPLAIKREEIPIHSTAWMNLEHIMLSDIFICQQPSVRVTLDLVTTQNCLNYETLSSTFQPLTTTSYLSCSHSRIPATLKLLPLPFSPISLGPLGFSYLTCHLNHSHCPPQLALPIVFVLHLPYRAVNLHL